MKNPECRACGWTVNTHAREVVGTLDRRGQTYHFCSFLCRQKLETQPASVPELNLNAWLHEPSKIAQKEHRDTSPLDIQ